jgi:hypothetical protein
MAYLSSYPDIYLEGRGINPLCLEFVFWISRHDSEGS